MAHIQYLDELIREYLLFRGFTNSLKSFDAELKVDKDKGFRVDKVVEQLIQYVTLYDLNSLRDLWNHLNSSLFTKLDGDLASGVRKLESSLYKLYLVNATVYNKSEKVNDFFSKMTPELQGQHEWKDWFMLPYMKNPEETMPFAVYFSKHWQDTLVLSLHNFLSLVYQGTALPVLCCYEEEARRVRRLQEENAELRMRLAQLTPSQDIMSSSSHHQDIMDDFYIISAAQGNGSSSSGNDGQAGKGHASSKQQGKSSPVPSRRQEDKHGTGGKTKLSHPTWTKHSSSEGVSKRSLSLDSRRARHSPDKTDLLILSQEKMSWHKAPVTQVRLNSNGSLVASTSTDCVLNIWSPNPNPKLLSSKKLAETLGRIGSGCIENVAWLSRNRLVVAAPHCIALLDVDQSNSLTPVWTLPISDSRILSISCSYSETTIAATAISTHNQKGKIVFIDVKTGNIEECIDTGSDVSYCSAWSPGGLLAGTTDGSVLSVSNSGYNLVYRPHTTPVMGVEVTSDGNACFTMSVDHKVTREPLVDGGENCESGRWSGDVRGSPSCSSTKQRLQGIRHCARPFSVNQHGTLLLTACGPNPPNIYQIGTSGVERVVAELSVNSQSNSESVSAVDWVSANQCSTVVASYGRHMSISTILTP